MNFMIQRTTDEHSLWFEEQVSKTRHEAVLPEQIDREFQPPCFFFSPLKFQLWTDERNMKETRNSLSWRSLARRLYATAMGGRAVLVFSGSLSLSRMGCWRIGHLPSAAPCISEVGKICCAGLETSSVLPEVWQISANYDSSSSSSFRRSSTGSSTNFAPERSVDFSSSVWGWGPRDETIPAGIGLIG